MRHEVDSDFKWVISLVTPPPSIPFSEGNETHVKGGKGNPKHRHRDLIHVMGLQLHKWLLNEGILQ